ncbi:hypothetical protein K469DRAFT_779716 [Zopfia rhizophila CBS 207.26]|uniref:Uncharacterized protein n=1 Tax=Zopfia rhizophila CBS 207.26 TaxID=1314779 RepID=A0A6A6E4B2_9PEZI|nr:hypothetical protein K469DRAFT_779716 [Zopfia rhizophila CBS 207.26]
MPVFPSLHCGFLHTTEGQSSLDEPTPATELKPYQPYLRIRGQPKSPLDGASDGPMETANDSIASLANPPRKVVKLVDYKKSRQFKERTQARLAADRQPPTDNRPADQPSSGDLQHENLLQPARSSVSTVASRPPALPPVDNQAFRKKKFNLIPEEREYLRCNGFCYFCREKTDPPHKAINCPQKKLFHPKGSLSERKSGTGRKWKREEERTRPTARAKDRVRIQPTAPSTDLWCQNQFNKPPPVLPTPPARGLVMSLGQPLELVAKPPVPVQPTVPEPTLIETEEAAALRTAPQQQRAPDGDASPQRVPEAPSTSAKEYEGRLDTSSSDSEPLIARSVRWRIEHGKTKEEQMYGAKERLTEDRPGGDVQPGVLWRMNKMTSNEENEEVDKDSEGEASQVFAHGTGNGVSMGLVEAQVPNLHVRRTTRNLDKTKPNYNEPEDLDVAAGPKLTPAKILTVSKSFAQRKRDAGLDACYRLGELHTAVFDILKKFSYKAIPTTSPSHDHEAELSKTYIESTSSRRTFPGI